MPSERHQHHPHDDHKPIKSDNHLVPLAEETGSYSEPENPWSYRTSQADPRPAQSIQWSASEFIDHEKPASWFLAVSGTGIVMTGFIYLVSRDLISSIAILMVVALFAIFGARKPRILAYELNDHGIHIGNKFYPYNLFKSFAIMNEDAITSILLSQFKRFTTPISLYFPPEQEDEIINFLGDYLPHEMRRVDPIDRLMRKVRF